MKSFADVKRRFAVGQVLRCVENTYRPEVNGTLRRIETVQTNAIAAQMQREDGTFRDDCPRREWFWLYFPKSARDVEIVDADTFRVALNKAGHAVTLQFVEAAP